MKIQYGKKAITKIKGNKTTEISQTIIAGSFVPHKRVHTEENIEVHNRAEQDAEYIRFADEEDRLQRAGRLVDAEFQIRRTPSATERGARYAIKKFTILDNSGEYGV